MIDYSFTVELSNCLKTTDFQGGGVEVVAAVMIMIHAEEGGGTR